MADGRQNTQVADMVTAHARRAHVVVVTIVYLSLGIDPTMWSRCGAHNAKIDRAHSLGLSLSQHVSTYLADLAY